MKAQKIRRTLWLANVALVAGVVGVAAWLLLDKPAEAKGTMDPFVRAVQDYKNRPVKTVLQPAVKAEDVNNVFLRPEWPSLPYFPFSGPKPPAPVEKVVAPVDTTPVPVGLEALGRPAGPVFFIPSGGEGVSSISWEFSEKGERGLFAPNDWVAAKGKPRLFRLLDIQRVLDPDPKVDKYRLIYEVYEKPQDATPKDKPLKQAEYVFDRTQQEDPNSRFKVPKAPTPPGAVKPGPAAGTGAATAGTNGPGPGRMTPGEVVVVNPDAAAAEADWRPSVRRLTTNKIRWEMTDATIARWKGKTIEQVLENVRTESYNQGGVQGLKLSPVGDTSIADKFDVQRGDVLISINGSPVHSREDAIRIVKSFPPDITSVNVVLDRDGQRITYEVDPRDPKTRRAAAGLQTQPK